MATTAKIEKLWNFRNWLREIWEFLQVMFSPSTEEKTITYLLSSAEQVNLKLPTQALAILGRNGPDELRQIKAANLLRDGVSVAICDAIYSPTNDIQGVTRELIALYAQVMEEDPREVTYSEKDITLWFTGCNITHHFCSPEEFRLREDRSWLILVWEDSTCRWHYSQKWVKHLGKGSIVLNLTDPPLLSETERQNCEETLTSISGSNGCFFLTTRMYDQAGLVAVATDHCFLTAVKKV